MAIWKGSSPSKCELNHEPIVDKFVDGVLRTGTTWAIMCPECHKVYGAGLGTGRGQLYQKRDDGKFVKVQG